MYAHPNQLWLNHWSLSGTWTVRSEHAELDGSACKIAFRFHARDLHMVLGRGSSDRAIRFRITLDGKPPGTDRGADVDAEGWGSLDQDRMYQLIRQAAPVEDGMFEIQFFEPGA